MGGGVCHTTPARLTAHRRPHPTPHNPTRGGRGRCGEWGGGSGGGGEQSAIWGGGPITGGQRLHKEPAGVGEQHFGWGGSTGSGGNAAPPPPPPPTADPPPALPPRPNVSSCGSSSSLSSSSSSSGGSICGGGVPSGSGSSAGSDWLSRSARERLLCAGRWRGGSSWSCPAANNSLNEILESQTLEDELGKSRGSPQKGKSRLIT